MKRIVLLVSLFVTPSAVMLAQTTNSWIDGNGKWETNSNWSHATAPSISDTADFITNATSKTVTIDGTTSGSFPATMTVSNLTISSLATNTLLLNNAGTITPLRVLNDLRINSGGALVMTNSALLVNGLSGGSFGDDGSVSLNSGSLIITNAPTVVGFFGQGSFINSGGTLLTVDAFVGSRSGAHGLAVFAAGTNTVSGFLDLGNYGGSTGTVLVTGGLLVVTNGIHVGDGGVGQMTVSNGTVQSREMYVGHLGGSQGTLTMAGGTNTLSSFLEVGGNSNGTGTVWVTGGQLVVTNDVTYVGNAGVGQLTIFGGTVLANIVHVGNAAGSQGTLTIAFGSLFVTNDAHNALTEVRYGTLTLITGGVFVTDSLLITNAGGRFINNGGTFVITGQAQVDQGTQTVASGTTQVSSNFVVGSTANSTGTVNITGGQLIVTNGVFGVGNSGNSTNGSGVGHVIVSNGTALVSTVLLGSSAGGHGDLTILSNGVVDFTMSSAGTNTVLVCNDVTVSQNGALYIPNGTTYAGKVSPGAITVSDNSTANCLDMHIGFDNSGTLTVSGGITTISSMLVIGDQSGSAGQVWVTGGQLLMTNPNLATKIGNDGVGQLTLVSGSVQATRVVVSNSSNPGTLSLQGGALTGNLLINPNGQLLFSQGQLTASATTNANGQTFVIGDGVHPATMTLTGGIHSFDNGLRVSANAFLTGCGTISGSVVVDAGGTVRADCGGTLTCMGAVNNTGTMRAAKGTTLEFYNGPVVNNGLIDVINGNTNFHGAAFSNSGTVLDASSVKISQVSKSGQDMVIRIPSVTGHAYQLQYTTSLTPATWTNTGESQPGNDLVLTFTDPGGAANAPARFYRVAVTIP